MVTGVSYRSVWRVLVVVLSGTLGFELALSQTVDNLLVPHDTASSIVEKRPGLSGAQLRTTAVDGLVEVTLDSNVAYITSDGGFLIKGEIINLDTNVNLTTSRRQEITVEQLSRALPYAIRFESDNPTREVFVVVDMLCTFCHRFHSNLEELLDIGISVNYLVIPSGRESSASWLAANSVLCSEDQRGALDRYFKAQFMDDTESSTGLSITQGANGRADTERGENEDCDNGASYVESAFDAGRLFGVRETPTFINSDGEKSAGYMDKSRMISFLRVPHSYTSNQSQKN